MADARSISVNRDFIVSGFLSGQAYRLAVRVDSAATSLIRLGLRDFEKAKSLEREVFDALIDLENTTKTARKMIDKVNRRRREGVPTSGPKQTFMVRSLPSAHAFRCAVAIDQVQRDIAILGLASSNDVAKVATDAQSTLTEAIHIADSVVQSVLKKTGSRRQVNKPKAKDAIKQNDQLGKVQQTKPQSSKKTLQKSTSPNSINTNSPSAKNSTGMPKDQKKTKAKKVNAMSDGKTANDGEKNEKAAAVT